MIYDGVTNISSTYLLIYLQIDPSVGNEASEEDSQPVRRWRFFCVPI